jgi:hypothetical protein
MNGDNKMAAKFESQIGARPIQGPSMREYVIPDESGFQPPQQRQQRDVGAQMPFDEAALQEFSAQFAAPPPPPQVRQAPSDIEQQFAEMKRLKREGKERLSDGAKRRIEMLIGMTRLMRDVEIDGKLYRLKTLSSKELRDALSAAADYVGVQFVFENRKQILARSLVVVAGVEIEQFLSSTDLEDRLEFMDLLDHSLLLRIYNEYNILAKESQDKYVIKTEVEVKEVLGDLKK